VAAVKIQPTRMCVNFLDADIATDFIIISFGTYQQGAE
jgi:hypothetical protein